MTESMYLLITAIVVAAIILAVFMPVAGWSIACAPSCGETLHKKSHWED